MRLFKPRRPRIPVRRLQASIQAAAALMLAPARLSASIGTALAGVTEVSQFGGNPGRLRMLVYKPPRLPAGAPLIVVLHGCGQFAAPFATDAGWIAFAQERRLALLLPEQSASNHHGRCFNWYRTDDVARGRGEALSIRHMVSAAVKRFRSDPRRVFIAGFSAGGAMTAALLAAYPAVFAAGAVVAGIPVGCAHWPGQAVMQTQHPSLLRSRTALADAVRSATRPRPTQKWPRLSIWTGLRDRTVAPGNAELLGAQWSELHGLGAVPAVDETAGAGWRRRAWGAPARPAVELWTLAELGHGFPVDPSAPGGGREGPWVSAAGISAAQRIARFWGIA